jgi:hypothetical protein
MSRRLVSLIQDTKKLPGRFKRVLMALASYANNDGTNVFPSKAAVGDKAGISKWTVYRNLDPLLEAGVLFEATSHKCRNPACNGPQHYISNGHWTQVYNLDVATLQNATLLREKLGSKMLLGQGSKTPKSKVAKGDATQSLGLSPLGSKENSSAVTSRELVRQSASYEESSLRSDSSPTTFKNEDPDHDPQWLQFMADPECAELYDQVGVHGGLALAMGLDNGFGSEHIPMLQRLTRWAHLAKKDVGYLRGLWLWSQTDKFWKTRVLGLDSMVKAIGNQTEKGLVAQYNRVLAKQKTKAANGNGHAPLWVHKKHDDGTTVRSLGRKPVTSMERDELIDVLQQPKINREYVLGFLVQDNCPECRGQDIGCECCVLTSEVLPAPPVAPAPPDCSHARVAEDGNTCLDCGSVKGAQHFRKGI